MIKIKKKITSEAQVPFHRATPLRRRKRRPKIKKKIIISFLKIEFYQFLPEIHQRRLAAHQEFRLWNELNFLMENKLNSKNPTM